MNIDEYIANYKLNKDKITLVDVREDFEFKDKRIDGAINVPLSKINSFFNLFPIKENIYYIYCRSGSRSSKAVEYLKSFGYKNIVNIGGIIDFSGDTIK